MDIDFGRLLGSRIGEKAHLNCPRCKKVTNHAVISFQEALEIQKDPGASWMLVKVASAMMDMFGHLLIGNGAICMDCGRVRSTKSSDMIGDLKRSL